jgi:hypothetical protein
VRIQSEHGVLAPLEMLVGMPLNHERSIAIAPVEQVSLRERAAQELEQPAQLVQQALPVQRVQRVQRVHKVTLAHRAPR